MKLETFFEKFDQFADAPDAVTKMRELVLHLAVHGNLVSQSAGDEPATELLKRSRAEMAKRMAARQAKQEKPADPVSDHEATFTLPVGWAWCRLVDAGQFINGLAFKPSDWGRVGRPIIRIQNLSGRNLDYNRTTGAFDSSVLVQDGDILVSWSATLDAFVWRGEEGVLNQHIFRVLPAPLADKGFLFWLLKWVIRQLAESDHAHGLVMSHINRGPFLAHPIPLPPLAEQKRIVAKVDELMALCDRLEAQQQERETRHAALARASLARFADAPTPANLHFLFHPSYAISPADLRKSILTLAVQGKLVPQDPNDEPVSQLLDRLLSLMAEAGKAPKSLLPIDADSLPFDLPISWEWVQAQDLCRPSSLITYGVLKPVWVDVGVPTVRVQDMQDGFIVVDGVGQCSPERAAKFGKTTLEDGDLLIAKDGATLGKTAFVPPSLAGGNITQHVLRFPMTPHVDRVFIRLVIDSPHGQAWMRSETKGVALPGVNVGDFRRMPIPLPPLAEQRRIVAKVEQLMALVDALETQLAASRATAANLLSALVAELTSR